MIILYATIVHHHRLGSHTVGGRIALCMYMDSTCKRGLTRVIYFKLHQPDCFALTPLLPKPDIWTYGGDDWSKGSKHATSLPKGCLSRSWSNYSSGWNEGWNVWIGVRFRLAGWCDTHLGFLLQVFSDFGHTNMVFDDYYSFLGFIDWESAFAGLAAFRRGATEIDRTGFWLATRICKVVRLLLAHGPWLFVQVMKGGGKP